LRSAGKIASITVAGTARERWALPCLTLTCLTLLPRSAALAKIAAATRIVTSAPISATLVAAALSAASTATEALRLAASATSTATIAAATSATALVALREGDATHQRRDQQRDRR
jgi:hypothetical protein